MAAVLQDGLNLATNYRCIGIQMVSICHYYAALRTYRFY